MSDNVEDIAAFYNSAVEREESRLERHQLEYDLTWRYLDQFLPPQGSVLEIGCATGMYTLGLAERGFNVTAVDMSTALLDECKKKIVKTGFEDRVQFYKADARDLSPIKKIKFDAVLLMGPLYHLVEEADRRIALLQAYEHLQVGGILFSAFISRFGIMGDLLRNVPYWIEDQKDVQSILQMGKDPDDHPRGGFRGYFARVAEICPLHESIGFQTIVMAGVEPAISADDESYNQLEGTQRRLWLDLLHSISTEESLIGASRHLLYIGRKP